MHLNKERLQGPGNKMMASRYGHFEALEKIGNNAYRLSPPTYMHILFHAVSGVFCIENKSILHGYKSVPCSGNYVSCHFRSFLCVIGLFYVIIGLACAVFGLC